jgi:predicted enzyme related to lactoylglutathione lyase
MKRVAMPAVLQSVNPVLASNDVTASVKFFSRLGFTLLFQDAPIEPKYAAVCRDGVELHIQWTAPEQWAHGTDRPVYRFRVSDVDALYAELVEAGGIDTESNHHSPWARPADTPWGTREFHLRDPGKNGLQFYCPLTT